MSDGSSAYINLYLYCRGCIVLVVILFILFLLYPENVFFSATKGLLLWYQTILPTLFPFIIITSMLARSNAISIISKWFSYPFCKIFHISPISLCAVISGFFCGYPMGAKMTADLVERKMISKEEGAYIISFCNNASPMFLIQYLLHKSFSIYTYEWVYVSAFFISPILCSFLFRKFHDYSLYEPINAADREHDCVWNILDYAIGNGCEVITKIGGYMMLFSVIIELCLLLPLKGNWWYFIVIPCLEMTNGIEQLLVSPFSKMQQLILASFIVSFGGVCASFQTFSVMKKCKISKKLYIIEKLITAAVTSFILYLFICVIR